MAKLNAQITLKDIVEEFFLKSKLPRQEYANIKQLAIRGYQDLLFKILPQGRIIVKDTMDSNNMVDMPDDLVELNAVYIADATGELWPLSKNRKITSTVSAGPTRDEESPDYEGVDVPNPGGSYYAATGGVNLRGYYIDDFPNRRIVFVNTNQSEIVLDYLSTGIEDTETAYVPVQTVGAIHAFIAFHYYGFRMDTPTNRIALYEDRLRREEAKLRNMRFNLEDFYQSILKTMSPSIQR